MTNNTLEFPRGIQLATADEIPGSPNKPELLNRIASAQLIEGFTLKDSTEPLFKYYAEINVSAPKIWKVFCSLCEELLPDEGTPLWGENESGILYLGHYASKRDVLANLEKEKDRLANDCFLRFGMIHQSKERLTEVLVAPSKHFKVWTNKLGCLSGVLSNFGIARAEKLEFIDEFPTVTRPLKEYSNTAQDFVEALKAIFGVRAEVEAA
jgi:hypothetical protein